MPSDELNTPREQHDYDVVIVGAGPAGLAAALRLGDVAPGVSIAIVEKGQDFGHHILSGAIIDPTGLDELVPEWRDEVPDLLTPIVTEERFLLTRKNAKLLAKEALPPAFSIKNHFVGSLGALCVYLGQKAEDNGCEIFSAYAASDLSYDEKGAVNGVITNDIGARTDGSEGPDFERGVQINAKYVLLGDGTNGPLSQKAIARFNLDKDCQPQKFALGLKELWKIPESKSRPGLVQNYMGWPLDDKTGGSGFIYHLNNNEVAIGQFVHLDYKNPYLDPFQELQKLKTHRKIKDVFKGARRIAYGARIISLGGYNSVPQLAFPGGALIGDSAGFVNIATNCGIDHGILSGIIAAQHMGIAISSGRQNDLVEGLEKAWKDSRIGKNLLAVKHLLPLISKHGSKNGLILGALDMWVSKTLAFPLIGKLLKGRIRIKPDRQALEPAKKHQPPAYPEADRVLVFDKKSSIALAQVKQRAGQPTFIDLNDTQVHKNSEWEVFQGPCTRYCPSDVFEWRPRSGTMKFYVEQSACIHCGACTIKDPNQNINFNLPEGGGGPNYLNM